MPTTFIHTADWHLGKAFHGIPDEDKRAGVRQARFDAIRRIGDVARQRNAAFVVVAGDNFDSPQPTKETVSAALAAIGSIGLPVYMIPGNHDHAGPGSVWESEYFVREHQNLAPNLHVLLDTSPVIRDDAVILPCPLLRRFVSDDPTASIRTADFSAFDERPRIVLAHGSTISFENAADGEETAIGIRHIELDRMPWNEVDYVALGDYHGFMRAGEKAWYAGSHEIDRFPKTDQRPGHIACVTIGRGAAPQVEPINHGKYRWLDHDILLDDSVDRLDHEITEAANHAGFQATLVALSLRGSVSLEGRRKLDAMLETWTARLTRFDVTDEVLLAPTSDEIDELARSADDPIIADVAGRLKAQLDASGDDAAIANEAMRILYGLCTAGGRGGA
jgi:DNA repair exonuclease SbcCD nuclease subunit